VSDQEVREALNRHWAASDSGDFATEHDIYHDDAVLDYPQSRERILGRRNIQITRTLQPNIKRFAIHRIIGSGDLWVTEYVLSYDGQPFYTVSIMEFRGSKVAHETQYFADSLGASATRKEWVVSMDDPKEQGTP
jgi:ketosteroid isomerase-like protein